MMRIKVFLLMLMALFAVEAVAQPGVTVYVPMPGGIYARAEAGWYPNSASSTNFYWMCNMAHSAPLQTYVFSYGYTCEEEVEYFNGVTGMVETMVVGTFNKTLYTSSGTPGAIASEDNSVSLCTCQWVRKFRTRLTWHTNGQPGYPQYTSNGSFTTAWVVVNGLRLSNCGQ